jgi:predicted Zn-dependent peptidase
MINRIALALALGVSTLGAQDIPDRPEKLHYKPLSYATPLTKDFKAKLKNGIPVYIAPDPSIAFVRLSLQIRGGSYLNPSGKEGLAGLFGSQWRAGGTLRTPAEQLDERLEFLAGAIESRFGATTGSLSFNVMEKDLVEGLKLFMEVLQEPAFAQDRIDLAKKNTLQGLERRNDAPQSIYGYTLGYLLSGENHWTTRPTTIGSLDAITQADLKAIHAKLLHPSNFVISVTGKFEKKVMLDHLNATLGTLKPGKDAQVSPKVPAPDFARKPGIYLADKDVPQSVVGFVLPGLRRSDPDWHATEVLNEILGGNAMTTRFMKKIRSDEGLTYGITSNFEPGIHWRGDWTCQFQTKNRSVAYALRLALAEIERIRKEPLTDEELSDKKRSILDGFPANFPSKGAIANTFASEAINGWPEDYWSSFREKIQAVTKEDIQRVAQKYLNPSEMIILAVGKASEVEEGDVKDHPGKLAEVTKLPFVKLPLRDPKTMKPIK